MSDETTRLKGLLAHHGADVSLWPLDVQQQGFKALKQPEFARLIVQERHFEEKLLERHMPLPSADFAQRIIAAALTRKQLPQAGWVRELLSEVRPAALAAMLVLGFTLGFNVMSLPTPSRQQTAAVPTVSDDEGALL